MSNNELMIKESFAKEIVLPKIVLEKKQAAYDRIYGRQNNEPPKNNTQKETPVKTSIWKHPSLWRAAALMLSCLVVAGGSTATAVKLLSHWERMTAMTPETMEQLDHTIQSGGNLQWVKTRELTESENQRYNELEIAYKNNFRFPNKDLPIIEEGDPWNDTGLHLIVSAPGEENILCLPERELTDEELLELIEMQAKEDYYFYARTQERIIAQNNWESRMELMTEEEIEYYFLAVAYSHSETSGYYKEGEAYHLSEAENQRLKELTSAYENENLCPSSKITLIDTAQDYTGDDVAFCIYDGWFYLPQRDLTDEDLLQIIEMDHLRDYVLYRIDREVDAGYRQEVPRPEGWVDPKSEQVAKRDFYSFADTYGQGSLKTLSEAQLGDSILFGSYNNQEIEWYVVKVEQEGEKLTLLSKNILDRKCWNSLSDGKITWEESELRAWLNNDFYQAAFRPEEQAKILNRGIVIDPERNPVYDKVHLLNYDDLWDFFKIDIMDHDRMLRSEDFDPRLGLGEDWWTCQYGHLYYDENPNLQTMANLIRPTNGKLSMELISETNGIRPVIQIKR